MKKNEYLVQCDYSGFEVPASETRMTWDGKRVHKRYWAPRHEQDFPPKLRKDIQTVPNMRPAFSEVKTNLQTYDALDYDLPVDYYTVQGGVNISGLEFGAHYDAQIVGLIPSIESVDYHTLTLKGKYMRIPFLAERMFGFDVNGNIDTTYLEYLKEIVDRVLENGSVPIIDMHNYAEFAVSASVDYPMGSADFTPTEFAEMWRKLALEFSYNSIIEFDLMNEPDRSSQTSEEWRDAMNECIAAIRGVGVNNLVHVSTQAASGVAYIFNLDRAKLLEGIVDSANNWILHLHSYFDQDYDGGNDLTVNSDIEGLRFYPRLFRYMRDFQKIFPNVKVHIGELGAGSNANGYLAMQNFFQMCYDNRDVVRSWTIWGAGQAWQGGYPLKLDPPYKGDYRFTPFVQVLSDERQSIGNQSGDLVLDWDFVNSKFKGTIENNISCARDTAISWAQKENGDFVSYGADTLRYTNRGLLRELRAVNLVNRDFIGTGTPVELSLATGQSDFLGGSNGFTLTESGVGSVVHRLSIPSDSVLGTDEDYVWQFLSNFPYNFWSWAQIQPTNNTKAFGILNKYSGEYEVFSGDWKTAFARGRRDSTTNVVRAQIAFQPDDTPAIFSLPDTYEAAIPPRVMRVCCPMITVGKRIQSPIFSSSANAVREKDDISFIVGSNSMNVMQNDSFALVMQIAHINEVDEVADFLSINGIIALRKNLDYSMGGDFGGTQSTAVPYDGRTNFRAPRKVGIAVDKKNGKVLLGIEGMDIVSIDSSIPSITSVKLEPDGGYMQKLKLKQGVLNSSQLKYLIERY